MKVNGKYQWQRPTKRCDTKKFVVEGRQSHPEDERHCNNSAIWSFLKAAISIGTEIGSDNVESHLVRNRLPIDNP